MILAHQTLPVLGPVHRHPPLPLPPSSHWSTLPGMDPPLPPMISTRPSTTSPSLTPASCPSMPTIPASSWPSSSHRLVSACPVWPPTSNTRRGETPVPLRMGPWDKVYNNSRSDMLTKLGHVQEVLVALTPRQSQPGPPCHSRRCLAVAPARPPCTKCPSIASYWLS